MREVVENAGADTGQTYVEDGKTYRLVTGGVTRIDKLNEGLEVYQKDLLSDPLASQRVEVCVITFGGEVKTIVHFVSASEFQPPKLTAGGETPMGAGILAAIESLSERKKLYKQHAVPYYRPWIFFITDGEPTDTAWREAAFRIREGEKNKEFAFFPVGVEGANFDILRQISVRTPLQLKGYRFREMFLWLSQSQRSLSHSTPGQENQLNLPPPSGWANL